MSSRPGKGGGGEVLLSSGSVNCVNDVSVCSLCIHIIHGPFHCVTLAFEQLMVKRLNVDVYRVYTDWSFGNF